MKVYVYLTHDGWQENKIVHSIFLHKKDAEDMEKSSQYGWVEEHEVIE